MIKRVVFLRKTGGNAEKELLFADLGKRKYKGA